MLTCIEREPRRPREFPNARLTIDRRHRVVNDPRLLAAQHKVGRRLLVIGIVFYAFGGFQLINSMSEGGESAVNAMIEGCKLMGLPVVAAVHRDEAILAQKVENYMLLVVVGGLVATIAILVYLLAT